MAKDSKEIIKQFAEKLTDDVKKAVPSATGETASGVRLNFRGKGFDIFVPSQVFTLIEGRNPTSPNAPKSTPTLQEKMLQWIRAKGIVPRESGMTDVSLSWAMSKSIHKNGYRGKGNIFADVITTNRINSLTKTLLDNRLAVVQSDIIKNIDIQ